MGEIVVDHFVYAVDDLDAASDRYVRLIKKNDPNSGESVNKPSYGGKHKGRGTHNALLSLGDSTYLEFIAVNKEEDPDFEGERASTKHRMFHLTHDNTRMPFVKALIVRIGGADASRVDANAVVEFAKQREVELNAVTGSRETATGDTLRWTLFVPAAYSTNSYVPLGIAWTGTEADKHPARTSPSSPLKLESVTISHQDTETVTKVLNTFIAFNESQAGSSEQGRTTVKVEHSTIPEILVTLKEKKSQNVIRFGNSWRSVNFRNATEAEFVDINKTYASLGFYLARPDDLELLVVESESGEFIGSGRVSKVDDHDGELAGIYIKEEYRKFGIARALVGELISRFRKTQPGATLWCIPFVDLVSFYSSFGFEKVAGFSCPEGSEENPQIPSALREKFSVCEKTFLHRNCLLLKLK